MICLIGIGILTILLYMCMVKPFQYWKRLGVAQYSLITVYWELFIMFIPYRSILDSIKKTYSDFPDKRYIGVYLFGKPTLFLRDPDLIKQLTIKDFEYFTDHFNMFPEDSENILVRTILILKGQTWKNMRMILSPSFTSRKLKTIFHLMIDCAKQLVNHFDEMEDMITTVEMKEVFSKLTNDVIATSAFGISCNSFENPNNDFYVMAKELTNFKSILANLKFMFIFTFPRIAQWLGIPFFKTKLVNFFQNIITQNIQSREKHGIVRPDMIHLLLEAKKKTSGYEEIVEEENEILYEVVKDNENKVKKIPLTDEDIVSQAFLFFFAGFEVVAVIMSFMAHELAVNPDVQEKLYQEIEENIKKFGKDPSYENLMKMKYLDMVVSESLRKYPSPMGDRVCTKSYIIQPTTKDESPIYLKAGNTISIPIYGLHSDSKYFPNPDRFDPERFNDENKHKITPGTYIPFGIGPRHCMGNRFAQLELKIAFYYILSKFKLVVVEKTQIPLKLARSQILMNAEKGFWLGLEKRVQN